MDNFSPVRIVRPLLHVSSVAPIRLSPGRASAPIVIRNAQTQVLPQGLADDRPATDVPTLLYGCARFAQDERGLTQEVVEPTDHVGVVLIGKDAGKLELVGPNATDDRKAVTLSGTDGEADGSVMAYNYRLILTRDPANRIMVSKPANFDPALAKAAGSGGFVPNLPNGKVAWNGGRLIGPQNDYPGGDWPTREAISKRHLDAMLMRLWWMQNDPDAPESLRKQFEGYGLAADEFPDNDHLPYEIYVREARRLVGRYVFREQDNVIAEGIARTPNPVPPRNAIPPDVPPSGFPGHDASIAEPASLSHSTSSYQRTMAARTRENAWLSAALRGTRRPSGRRRNRSEAR